MDGCDIYFLGAGGRNVVFGCPLRVFGLLTHTSSTPVTHAAETSHVALRFSTSTVSECDVCLLALASFTGPHYTIPLIPGNPAHTKLLALVAALSPEAHRRDVSHCTSVTVLPNFVAHMFRTCSMSPSARPMAPACLRWEPLWTVELKPKATWRRPVVVGVRTPTATHVLHPIKRTRCRFSLHEIYQQARSSKSRLSYCPAQLYHGSHATEAGLAVLSATQNKHFHMLRSLGERDAMAPRFGSAPSPSTTTIGALSPTDLTGLAAALDASGVLAELEHIQLFGLPKTTEGSPSCRAAPVLDIQLLYHWAVAAREAGGADKARVQWLYDVDAPAADSVGCECLCVPVPASATVPYDVTALRAEDPPVDLATCITRFYAATTAKDVSLLISAADARSGTVVRDEVWNDPGVPDPHSFLTAGVLLESPEHHRLYRIGAVDIDNKSVKSLEHYYEQDRAILSAWDTYYAECCASS